MALGTISLRLRENLRTIGVDASSELIQRSVLLGSARILRKGRFLVSLDNWFLPGTNENHILSEIIAIIIIIIIIN